MKLELWNTVLALSQKTQNHIYSELKIIEVVSGKNELEKRYVCRCICCKLLGMDGIWMFFVDYAYQMISPVCRIRNTMFPRDINS